MTPKIVFMAALRSRGGHYCGFFYLFSSPNLSRRRLDVYHTSTHGVAIGSFSATVSKTVRPMLSVRCLSVCLSIVQAIEYLISVGPTCRYSMASLLAGVGQLSQLAKLCVALNVRLNAYL